MAIIGTIIKKAIEIGHTLKRDKQPVKRQYKQLSNLLSKASNTSFGQYYGFKSMLKSDDIARAFQQEVPIFTYETIAPWWKQQQKHPDITWPGKPAYFALSSGTTGKESKRIPVTEDMLNSIRSVSLEQVESLSNFDLPDQFFEKQILALGSSTNLKENSGFLEGEISGINASTAPQWFDYFYKPGEEITQIDDWDERLQAIIKDAKNWDIGALAGIPSWVLLMLKAIVKHYELNSIHELWPDLMIYTSGGVAFETYQDSFEELFSKPVIIMDTYLASEGYFAFNARPGTNAMQLALHNDLFFEFIPFNADYFDEAGQLVSTPECLLIDDVELNRDYVLVVSTPAGTWRYIIGDTIQFTSIEKSEIIITGRTKYFMNVVGSQLSEHKLNGAIEKLGKEFDIKINEFCLAALKDSDGNFFHQWVLGTSSDMDEEKTTKRLDEILKDMNKNYAVARNKALQYIKLKAVPKQQIYDWMEENGKKGGQTKVPKVMSGEKMEDLMKYLHKT